MQTAAKALVSYSHKDESFRTSLVGALATCMRAGEIELWSDHQILAGKDIDEEILAKLKEADLILLLVSQDFVASDYCFKKELQIALERHENGRAAVIPIIIRPTDLQGLPFAHLKMLPNDAKPVTTWANSDEAWLNVAQGVRDLLRSLDPHRNQHGISKSKTIRARLSDNFDALGLRYANPNGRLGVSWGYAEIDDLADGIRPGELAMVASRPDHGHVELASSVGVIAALRDKRRVLVLSQRLSAHQYTNSMLCALGVVSRARLARGLLEDEDWSRVASAIRMLRDTDITVDDDAIRSESALKQKLREVSIQQFDLFVVDGIEYLNSGAAGEERAIALTLADFAKRQNISVIATLTLGASLEERAQREPFLSDLDEWRALENFASKILFCHREDMYSFDGPQLVSEISVFVAKSSDGLAGVADLKLYSESGCLASGAERIQVLPP